MSLYSSTKKRSWSNSIRLCLLERLAFLWPGARAAAERRQGNLRLVERRRREAQAYMLAFQARGLGREGTAFVI